jgi:hypothetical protein
MIVVLILFRLIMMVLLWMSLDMILMPMEPSVGSSTGAHFEGPFVICNDDPEPMMLQSIKIGLQLCS